VTRQGLSWRGFECLGFRVARHWHGSDKTSLYILGGAAPDTAINIINLGGAALARQVTHFLRWRGTDAAVYLISEVTRH
jgi:hypothetical protein